MPGWLDKSLKWRHRATHYLDTMVLLEPKPEWVKTLPNGKLPHLDLDAGELHITRIRLGTTALAFDKPARRLRIFLPTALPTGSRHPISIAY